MSGGINDGTSIAGGAIAPYRLVIQSTTAFRMTQAGANGDVAGVYEGGDTLAAGDAFNVRGEGSRQIEAGGTIAAGDELKSDANGKVVKAAGGGNENIVGVAEQAGASGEVIRVRYMRYEADTT